MSFPNRSVTEHNVVYGVINGVTSEILCPWPRVGDKQLADELRPSEFSDNPRRLQPSFSGHLTLLSDGFQPVIAMALNVDDFEKGPGPCCQREDRGSLKILRK